MPFVSNPWHVAAQEPGLTGYRLFSHGSEAFRSVGTPRAKRMRLDRDTRALLASNCVPVATGTLADGRDFLRFGYNGDMYAYVYQY